MPAGLYNIYVEYYPVESRGIDIERAIYVNGEIPFTGADVVTFHRIWGDVGEITTDNQGNEIRPSQEELPQWEGAYIKDYMGYYTEPYSFYFEAGENTFKMESVTEPMAVRSIQIKNADKTKSYVEYQRTVADKYKDTGSDFVQVVQGEDSARRSSPSLYSIYDRSSGATDPASTAKIKLNMTGGQQWRVAGQWIEWDIIVPEDGLYELTIKGRQNYNRGFVSCRSLYIDGKIPFEEVSSIGFKYSNNWDLMTLSDTTGDPYLFALDKGTHRIRLEVTLGDLGDTLNEMSDSVFRMNEIYRKILVLTGPNPDRYRDYQIANIYPDIVEAMGLESKRLYKIVDELVAHSGQRGSQVSTTQTLADQLERFEESPDKIHITLKNYKENISSMGTSIQTISEAPLDIDYIVVSAPSGKLPKVKENFFTRAGHEFKSFMTSFFVNYNSLGNVYDDKEAIDVWILTGRDQSTILKTMVDDTFTPQTNIPVNLRLVEANTLLPSVVAGTGPDVALSVAQGEPVNYALRSAAEELSKYPGFDQLKEEYYDTAFNSFRYDGGIYALPETQNFNVLFYRTDILEEMEMEIPQTWDELVLMLPDIQKNNMNVGIPSIERRFGTTVSPDLSNLFALFYQRGGEMYNEEGSRILLDTEIGVDAFEYYTTFFTHYKLPTYYDFASRFRTGEMPIGVYDYSMYNTLVVFAPEIRGLWDFTLLPGTIREDGTLDRTANSWGTASMLLATSDNKDDAWEFLKWWGGSETQIRFGRELESVMGSAARYATANKIAFDQLPWSRSQSDILKEQWEWVTTTPEVPGGYYTSRHIVNAIRKVINENEDPRETLLDYTITINDELKKKRQEFGLE